MGRAADAILLSSANILERRGEVRQSSEEVEGGGNIEGKIENKETRKNKS